MGKFGWSYPPGCSGPPDDDRGLPPAYEALSLELEEAGVSPDLLNRLEHYVCGLLSAVEQECSACVQAVEHGQEAYDDEAS